MTPRLKSALLLFGTLLIGMVLGGILHARMAEERVERIAYLRSPSGFIRFMERTIEPESEEQRQAIRSVLQEAAERLSEHHAESRETTRAIVDSTRAELRVLLTDEQETQLRERLEQMRQRRPRRRPPARPE